MRFYFIILGLPILSLVWWCWADRQLANLRVRSAFRWVLGAFVIAQVVTYAWLVISRFNVVPQPNSATLVASAYIWHLLALPLAGVSAAVAALGLAVSAIRRKTGSRHSPTPATTQEPSTDLSGVEPQSKSEEAAAQGWTRRQMLVATAVALPPVFSIVATGRSLYQVQHFRVRTIDVPIPGLPTPLEGMTIAHVSDMHVGRFTNGAVLRQIVDATNALRADLTLVTGDLIDYAISDLPAALDAVKKLDARSGVYCCEGNHDLFDDRDEFEHQARAARIGMLLNEAAAVRVRGVDVQLLGLRWGSELNPRAAELQQNLPGIIEKRSTDAFPILLAHHPHAFDAAVDAGIPLTLSGHTHGGQLMLGPNLGAGPLMFKYWSGLYTRAASSLVVSNGTGNWFPLRTFAPAEIVHITLRAAPLRA